ncbi:tetratricopeptide repeat protein [Myceligenerans cantabricum]
MWVYGLAGSATIVVGVVATVLPASVPEWVRQTIITAGIVGSCLGAILVERWFSLDDRRRAVAVQHQKARDDSVNLAVRPPGDADAPGRLLSPVRDGDRQVVTFLGREREFRDLRDWCTDGVVPGGHSLRVQLVTGPGGVGKTRLAQELQATMRHEGWECRNLRTGVEAEAMGVLREGHGDAPVLFVVDYAENRHDGLATLLEHANDDAGTVRVLLLARQSGQWWTDLCQLPGVGAVAGAADPLELSPRVLPRDAAGGLLAEQQAIVRAAARDFSGHLGIAVPTVPLPESVPGARMLDLLSIALIQVLRQQGESRPAGSDGTGRSIHAVFDELLRHEARDWERSARRAGLRTDSHTLRTLVAAGCLLGAADQTEAEDLARRVARLCTHDAAPDPAAAARWLREQYPPPDPGDHPGTPSWLGSLHPDRLAEHLAVSALAAADAGADARRFASAERRAVLLQGLNARQAVRAMIILTRAASDPARHGGGTPGTRSLRGGEPRWGDDVALLALELVERLPARRSLIAAVHEVVPWPDPPSSLHAVGHRLAERLYACLSWGSRITTPEHTAHAHYVLGNWEHTLGHFREALTARERAVQAYRVLAARDLRRYGSRLVRSLDSLGDSYASLGRYEEALMVRREAVRRWEGRARAPQDRYGPELARSLRSLGISYRDRGQSDFALTTHREGLAIWRVLAEQSELHTAELARTLGSVGRCLVDLGDLPAAREAFLEALSIWRRLDARTTSRYEPDLAYALGDLGVSAESFGRSDEALDIHDEATALWRSLVVRVPERHLSGLARSLTNIATSYAHVGRFDDSRAAHREAVNIYRELVTNFPARRFEPNLAWSLGSSAASLADEGLDAAALDVFAESLDLYRRRRAEGMRSLLFLSGFRSALERAAVLLEKAGRVATARSLREEAASIGISRAPAPSSER